MMSFEEIVNGRSDDVRTTYAGLRPFDDRKSITTDVLISMFGEDWIVNDQVNSFWIKRYFFNITITSQDLQSVCIVKTKANM